MLRVKPTTWIDVEQGTDEWHRARMGIPTASRFSDVLARSKDMKQRTRYLHELAAEQILKKPVETYSNRHMERGQEMEADVRYAFELMTGRTCERVGFATNGVAGASPDSRTGPRRGAEFKSMKPDLLVGQIYRNKFPTEHYAQCQGVMWVCDWDEMDLVVFWPGLPPFHWVVERDKPYIEKLHAAVIAFNRDLQKVVRAVKQYGKR